MTIVEILKELRVVRNAEIERQKQEEIDEPDLIDQRLGYAEECEAYIEGIDMCIKHFDTEVRRIYF